MISKWSKWDLGINERNWAWGLDPNYQTKGKRIGVKT